MTITCDNCGAIGIAPSALESVKCGYCHGEVTIRADVRERVEAANKQSRVRAEARA